MYCSISSSLKINGILSKVRTPSLACQPARITHAMCNEQQLEEAGVTRGMLRISVGLEEVSVPFAVILLKLIPNLSQAEDIISDLDQALQRALLQK